MFADFVTMLDGLEYCEGVRVSGHFFRAYRDAWEWRGGKHEVGVAVETIRNRSRDVQHTSTVWNTGCSWE